MQAIASCGLPYSYLSAAIGSMRIARRAGRYPATAETTIITATAPPITTGSSARTPRISPEAIFLAQQISIAARYFLSAVSSVYPLIFRPKVGRRTRIDPMVHMLAGVFPFGTQIAHLRHVDLYDMYAETQSNRKNLPCKVRAANLDAPTLVDRISAELLDHLTACRMCSSIFAGQEESLEEAGCLEGQRMISESRVRWQERRANLAIHHLTGETLDDYIFGRLACDEWEAAKHHLTRCPRCAKAIQQRETLATWIRAALHERKRNPHAPSTPTIIQVRCATCA